MRTGRRARPHREVYLETRWERTPPGHARRVALDMPGFPPNQTSEPDLVS